MMNLLKLRRKVKKMLASLKFLIEAIKAGDVALALKHLSAVAAMAGDLWEQVIGSDVVRTLDASDADLDAGVADLTALRADLTKPYDGAVSVKALDPGTWIVIIDMVLKLIEAIRKRRAQS